MLVRNVRVFRWGAREKIAESECVIGKRRSVEDEKKNG